MEARYVIINEMYDLWEQLKRGIKDNTFENYKYMYNTFVRPSFGKKRIQTLKKSDVKIFYNYLADERCLQASTIDSIHTVLHQVLDMAVDDKYIRNNPSDKALKELKQSHAFKTEKRRALTIAEQELFLNYLRNNETYSHWYPIFAVMLGTGMRVGEITGLRWCDIDLDNGVIDINHTCGIRADSKGNLSLAGRHHHVEMRRYRQRRQQSDARLFQSLSRLYRQRDSHICRCTTAMQMQ